MGPLGACRTCFTSGKTSPLASWVTTPELETQDEIFAPGNGGYGPALNWYKAQIANLNTPDDEGVSEDDRHVKQPTLLVTCGLDYIGVPALQEGGMRPWVKDLKVVELESGHWVQIEKADEVNEILENFIK